MGVMGGVRHEVCSQTKSQSKGFHTHTAGSGVLSAAITQHVEPAVPPTACARRRQACLTRSPCNDNARDTS